MGRKRKRVVRAPKKKIPKVFLCPKCGVTAVYVISKNKLQAQVKCGSCGFGAGVPVSSMDQPVDLYCKFTDMFYSETQ